MSRTRRSSSDPVANAVTAGDIAMALSEALKGLTPREAKVLTLRYGLEDEIPKTLDEIGKILGASRERVRQIDNKALTKLREQDSAVLKELLESDFPPRALAHFRGAPGALWLLHCPRHGVINTDSGGIKKYLEMKPDASSEPPRHCPMCPCPLFRGWTGRPRSYCDDACRQAALRFRRTHPAGTLTPWQITTAVRQQGEGYSLKAIAESCKVTTAALQSQIEAAGEQPHE